MWLLGCTCMQAARHFSYPYAVPAEPWAESFGNHRAVLRVGRAAPSVSLRLWWRRPDARPAAHRFLLVDAATGDTVRAVRKVQVDNEQCNIEFGPVRAAGTYYFYYLPYTVQPGCGSYYRGYLADRPDTCSLPAALRADTARVERIEARTAFDSFYPMEVAATRSETLAYRQDVSADVPFYLFPEDRSNPIRMRGYLPLRWMDYRQGDAFSGEARPNEYYAFQVGVWSPDRALSGLTVSVSDLKTAAGKCIPASAVTCFNTEGIDMYGHSFRKELCVEAGRVQALWFGVDVPADASAGTYRGTLTLRTVQGVRTLPVVLRVGGAPLVDRGDSEPWRHSRLRWLNSVRGLADTPVVPYTAMQVRKNEISCLGRRVRTGRHSLLPHQLTSWGTDILYRPVRFVVRTATGECRLEGRPQFDEHTDGHVSGSWQASCEDFTLTCRMRMEFDGWMNYVYTVRAHRDVHIEDVRLELPVRNEAGTYFLGAGLPGQETPAAYEGRWDTPETTVDDHGVSIPVNKQAGWLWPFDSFWIGSAAAGIHCELRGSTYSGPLLNAYRPPYPASWDNGGKGGFSIRRDGHHTLVSAYSGARTLAAGDTVSFDFALIVTPVKRLDTHSQFTDRYYHNGGAPEPTDADIRAGVRVVNVHHANKYNPFINYPFLATDSLKAFVDRCHTGGCKVKLYYTLRELTSALPELWAIRSLGTEILRGGSGGGYPWLREHLVADYTPQWYQHFDDGSIMSIPADAALLTSEGDTRWYNYYIEGLHWMVSNLGIDGIYLDDVSFGRDVLKRMRRVMDEVKPGCLIDLHSNTGFSHGPANQYMEFFPYIDKTWFGESFQYNRMSPANYLVESSSIPYGLMGDMLHAGGNKWLGMQYGMTVRHPWLTEGVVCDPRVVWKVWDDFGIADACMTGFWEKDVPVTTTDPDVKVTVYRRRDGRLLLSLGNYTDQVRTVRLVYDRPLGRRIRRGRLVAPEIPGFQPARTWQPADSITVEPRKGWLIYLQTE